MTVPRIFDITGMALQDVAAAAFLYENAQRQGSGLRLDFAACGQPLVNPQKRT